MELDEAAAIIGTADFFRICTDEQRRLLAFAGERRRHEAGAYLYRAGDAADGAHVLVAGQLRSCSDGDEAEDTCYVIETPGDLIGETGLIVSRPRRASVKALTEAETLFVPRAAFTKLLQQYPDMARRVEARMREALGAYIAPIAGLGGKLKPK